MPISKISQEPTLTQLASLTKTFPQYIKLVADVQKNILYGGGRLHADMEAILIDSGSRQSDVWGGGVSLTTNLIDCRAIANIRPGLGNPSIEIINPQIRKKFIKLVKLYFPNYEAE